ncbi:hypothetical protein ACFSKN_02060 [Mariniflexile gromovii]|uniref:Viral coat protein P2 N-terminal domain-containing protein n=1 Tax=Mariniflexile gromovii TaxID=362523 RepID=A0ABS4BPA4_9FLAO|nr:hypothetical protein [Mariniflexile gromovii]MBP0902386.1 hypothetical protein [Mariniflexile gromovii]
MKQVIDFNSGQIIKVTEENVGGILIDFKALEVDGTTVAAIANLNIIPLKISVKRAGSARAVEIVDDYLDYILRALHSASTRYDISITERATGYLMKIPFDGDLNLRKGDELSIEMKAPTTAFTDLSIGVSNITIETFPAVTTNNPYLTIVRSHTYPSGTDYINETIGNNVVKVTLVHDLGADYLASTEAKPTNGIILEANGLSKDASENLLIQENIDYLQMNPETPIQDLVIYNSMQPIMNAKLKAKYNKAVVNSARIMMLQRVIL